MRSFLRSCFFFAMLLFSAKAWSADSLTLLKVDVFATISQVGLTVNFSGDDNGNATAQVRYRLIGASSWVKGHPLLRGKGRRFFGSLFDLQPQQLFEIEITFQDPDGAPSVHRAQVQTRPDAPSLSQGRQLYVSTTGKDSNDGSKAAPWATIQKAADQARAGDTIHVAPGVYRESVVIRKSGEEGNPITFVADGAGVILDGSEPTLTRGAAWKDEGQGIYSTAFSKTSLYAAIGDRRLYDYQKYDNFVAENGKQSGKNGILKGGFWVDTANKKIFVRLPDRSSPSLQDIHVGVLDVGIRLDTVHDVVIRGFEIRYYGGTEYGSVGIDVRESYRCWIQKNIIHHVNAGVVVRKTSIASHNVIEDNHIRDTEVWNWDWSSVKAKTAEASAISINHGRGNVVRRNRLEGQFNGIYVGSFSDTGESVAQDTDVLDNQLKQHGDDGLEPEGACLNVRFLRNRMDGVHNGVSLAPIVVGPLWLIRTTIHGYKSHALKLNNGSSGWIVFYHTTALPSSTALQAQTMAPTIPFGPFLARNNLWVSNRYLIEYADQNFNGVIDLDYNLWWSHRAAGEPWFKWKNVRYTSLADFTSATGMETHGVAAKPLFEKEAQGDLRPAAGAAMIDVGVWIDGVNRLGTLGNGPDIGAFERGQTPPVEPSFEPPQQEPTQEAKTEPWPDGTEQALQEVPLPSEGRPFDGGEGTFSEGVVPEVTLESSHEMGTNEKGHVENVVSTEKMLSEITNDQSKQGGCSCQTVEWGEGAFWFFLSLLFLVLLRQKSP